MSTLAPQIRTRLPRFSDADAVRSRLALVPPRLSSARRTPFVVLIFAVLATGVVGLLMFNTQMQQASFHATALQARATALAAQQQSLDMELQQLRDPQRLALRARGLGMVVPPNPAVLRLSDDKVLGIPVVAGVADFMRVRGYAAPKPALLAPRARIVRVQAPPAHESAGHEKTGSHATAQASAQMSTQRSTQKSTRKSTQHRGASPKSGDQQGRKSD